MMTAGVVTGLLRVAAVGLLSAGIGGSAYLIANRGTADEPQPATQAVATQDLPTPTPDLAAPTPTPLPTPATPPAPGRIEDCPPGWQLFDNTVLRYTICYPPGWGIQSQASANPVAVPPREELVSQITIGGPGWFPSEPGGTTIDALPPEIQQRVEQAPRILLNFAPPNLEVGEGCRPNIPETLSDLQALWCVDTYSIPAHERTDYRPDGDWTVITVLVPLRSPEEFFDLDTTGLQLQIAAVSLTAHQTERQDLFWQIIRSIKVY